MGIGAIYYRKTVLEPSRVDHFDETIKYVKSHELPMAVRPSSGVALPIIGLM